MTPQVREQLRQTLIAAISGAFADVAAFERFIRGEPERGFRPGAWVLVRPGATLEQAAAAIRGNLCGVFARDRALFVALLDPAWEARLGEQRPLDAEEWQRLAAEVARATGWRAGQMTGPALLTSTSVRRVLRDALALEFPWLGVLAFSELDPMFELMPIAVVAWGLRAS